MTGGIVLLCVFFGLLFKPLEPTVITDEKDNHVEYNLSEKGVEDIDYDNLHELPKKYELKENDTIMVPPPVSLSKVNFENLTLISLF